jgi:hypothetical protein
MAIMGFNLEEYVQHVRVGGGERKRDGGIVGVNTRSQQV